MFMEIQLDTMVKTVAWKAVSTTVETFQDKSQLADAFKIIRLHTASVLKKTKEVETIVQKSFASTIAPDMAFAMSKEYANVMKDGMVKTAAWMSSQSLLKLTTLQQQQ